MIVGDVKLVGDSKLRFTMNLVFICKCTTQYKRNGYVRFDKISRKNPFSISFSIGVRDFFLSLTGNLWHMMRMRNTHIVSGTFCLIDVKPISFSRRENVMQLRKISASANILHCKSTLKWQCSTVLGISDLLSGSLQSFSFPTRPRGQSIEWQSFFFFISKGIGSQ